MPPGPPVKGSPNPGKARPGTALRTGLRWKWDPFVMSKECFVPRRVDSSAAGREGGLATVCTRNKEATESSLSYGRCKGGRKAGLQTELTAPRQEMQLRGWHL